MSHAASPRSLSRALLTIVLALFTTAALAQDPPTVRVRGTIDRVEGDTLIVKARDGAVLNVKLAENGVVVATIKAGLSEIKPGVFVGVSGMPQADGSQRALEVHIFPEAMRGTGEGHYGWDLQPQSTMTNGNVEHAVATSDGQSVRLKYKEGEKQILVLPETPIVAYQPADKSELKQGARIFIAAARKQPDGTLIAPRISVGRTAPPPM
jgi:hypothetical protein